MMNKHMINQKRFYNFLLSGLVLFFFLCHSQALANQTVSNSTAGRLFQSHPPKRVVSLVPSATEVLFEIGAGGAVVGVTLHDTWPPQAAEKTVVGGFFSPSADRIRALKPDLILLSDIHGEIKKAAAAEGIPVLTITTESLAAGYGDMLSLGRLFKKEPEAKALVERLRNQLRIINEKTAKIPVAERRRVVRLMGRTRVMAPGDDSFQNDLIRAAGGIPPSWGKTGAVVPVSLAQWTSFNPQVVYGCGGDRQTAAAVFDQPGWRDVAAVKTGRIHYFPCELTCRVSPNTGHFVNWLAARLYPEQFSIASDQVFADGITDERAIAIDLPCVREARVYHSRIRDFVNKTLVVDLAEPMTVVSTLDGERRGIETIGNHFCPMPGWIVGHSVGVETLQKQVCHLLQRSVETASFLFTGADMDHLSVQRLTFKEMVVYALVTAGVSSNALRASRDTGGFYEPGTINILVLTNMALSPRAMTRAIITATEAKTAALLDMDIRSSYTSRRFRATGTGTDNIIVGRGTGRPIKNTGGHSKMGELIAAAVHQGVTDAVFRQNGIRADRNIFHRLQERDISVGGLLRGIDCGCGRSLGAMGRAMEEVLMQDRYAGFMDLALSLSDDYGKGLIRDLSAFKMLCEDIADEIAGEKIAKRRVFVKGGDMPVVVGQAFDAILNGLMARNAETTGN